MKFLNLVFIIGVATGIATSPIVAMGGLPNNCIQVTDVDLPFPLGIRAPLPWDTLDGYWSDYAGTPLYYRIEVLDLFKDGSRTIALDLTDYAGTTTYGTGVGFVRAGAWEMAARVRGQNLDVKIRLQAFFRRDNKSERVLVASLQDLYSTQPTCMIRKVLKKVNSLEGQTEAYGCKK